MRTGLALGGGGVYGAAHIAYLEVFEDFGILPYVMSGTSSGAVIAALFAGGLCTKEIIDFLDDALVSKRSIFQRFMVMRKTRSIEAFARQFLLNALPCKTFEELRMPVKIVAADFHTFKEKVFEKGDLLKALMCSIALPKVMDPQQADGAYYIDGGAVNIVPFDVIRDDCDTLIAIDVSNFSVKNLKPTAKNAARAAFAATHRALMEQRMKNCPVELFERSYLGHTAALEFNRFKDIYMLAQAKKPAFAQKLKMIIERSSHNA